MRFDAATCEPRPWKNQGGVTRELASCLEAGETLWRLSLADIDRDGAFSAFPGFERIHTIILGQGLTLTDDDTTLQARPCEPLVFSGDLAVSATLTDGPCRAFNVIFDPLKIQAEATIVETGEVRHGSDQAVLFMIKGRAALEGGGMLEAGQGILWDAPASANLESGAMALCVRLKQLD
ncbi:hypothetical protein DS909_04445 [Phaeobacter gallaeciensis]|uniref:HutD family protein n=2 Tax=Roseobacteraceae TaxID=2854170 RepID=A0A366X6D1_9RHOB|nr:MULTISPECIES: HutD family protein [Roseobacteraceae]MBT3142323.1 HutD family protein [Falsiruegeria litorea]MBT8169449.1 HutD family protein [Falsiruegeria litorea]RBW60673.1 hypothetical protein DS909_04445 [Phaeobacter gallaeciensis]